MFSHTKAYITIQMSATIVWHTVLHQERCKWFHEVQQASRSPGIVRECLISLANSSCTRGLIGLPKNFRTLHRPSAGQNSSFHCLGHAMPPRQHAASGTALAMDQRMNGISEEFWKVVLGRPSRTLRNVKQLAIKY
ncbi:hypothetical protein EVAR_38282_1 [Eumeta japonica]|uniref:Uncharacterized protein n=1 Tax=Eumeta variegata TaxID=151549 RepID=A0A4C1W8D4_EUMVA|nr:hypothetical protein EVAR_38282_1 [Eumeta japonica]